MKNFPDKFPLRYAIIVQHTDECRPFYGLSRKDAVNDDNVMFQQLLEFLQKNPLLEKDLCIGAYEEQSSDFPDNNGKYRTMTNKLVTDKAEWGEIISTHVISSIGNEGCSAIISNDYYELILLSYSGNLEIPWFWKITNCSKIDSLSEFRYEAPEKEFLSPIDVYNKVFLGEENEVWLNGLLLRSRKAYKLSIPYSSIWEKLDNGEFGGITWIDKSKGKFIMKEERSEIERFEISDWDKLNHLERLRLQCRFCEEDQEENKQEFELTQKMRITDLKKYDNRRIDVLVTRSWNSLFYTEISELYKKANYC